MPEKKYEIGDLVVIVPPPEDSGDRLKLGERRRIDLYFNPEMDRYEGRLAKVIGVEWATMQKQHRYVLEPATGVEKRHGERYLHEWRWLDEWLVPVDSSFLRKKVGGRFLDKWSFTSA